MKKKIWIPVIVTVVLLAVLFIPIPKESYDDGGTREYIALTYKIVSWKRLDSDGVYQRVRMYTGEDRNKTVDELWEIESQYTNEPEVDPGVDYKPVIYLYPEIETDVSVELTLDGRLTCTYPKYKEGWRVTASPDGTLTDANAQTYNYLYWEAETYARYDLSEGFCIKGSETAEFLENALESLGLNRREANEFIVYWLPMMEGNPYNIISFQSDIYTDAAKLKVTPEPDTLIRVFMAWQRTEDFVSLPEQKLASPERNGFTVIEWGGTEIQ